MSVLNRTVPDQASALRASAIEDLLSKASQKGELRPATMSRLLSDKTTRSKIEALFEGEPDAKVFMAKLDDALQYASRISKQGTTSGGSPTAPLLGMQSALKGVPILEGIVPAIKEKVLRIPTSRQIALAMNSKDGREALLGMLKPKATSAGAIAKSAIQFATIVASESDVLGYGEGE